MVPTILTFVVKSAHISIRIAQDELSRTPRRSVSPGLRVERSAKHGGGRARIDLDEALMVGDEPRHDLLDLNEVLDQLAGADPEAAELVKLRFLPA